jgi:predicted dehydrogenase
VLIAYVANPTRILVSDSSHDRLPILVQPEYIKKALLAGKHVLSEKPIAKDYETAKGLIDWYHGNIDSKTVFWGVAENYRFIDSLQHGASIVESGVLGRISTFHTHLFANVKGGNLSFETAWRQKPEYQGGFLLDGGVHFIAGTRVMLGQTNPIVRLSAFTKLTRDYLPPVDTVDAILKTKTGIIGSFSVSFGSSTSGSEYTITGEKGYVSVTRGTAGTGGGALVGSMSSWVVSQISGAEPTKREFPNEGTGVQQEVISWAQSLCGGKALDERQTPANALKDLELVSDVQPFAKRLGDSKSNGYGCRLRKCCAAERTKGSRWKFRTEPTYTIHLK